MAEAFKNEVFSLIGKSHRASSDVRYRGQLLDAAGSVPKNIAEGFLRFSPGEFCRFFDYSVSSLVEAEDRLADGVQLGYFRQERCQEARRLARRCLTATIRLKHSQKFRGK